ncbi:hypothetical protein [Achromobacter phage shaaii_LB5]|nr:hypothetical protein [Achromobacter phage shaaii_LB5]
MAMKSTTVTPQPNAQYIREELAAMLSTYRKIADCLGGSKTIKDKGTLYLPMPNPADHSNENKKRYENYLERAVFYNVVKRTIQGLTGQVTARPPVIEVPDALDSVVRNATGTGLSLEQTAKRALNYGLAYARGGIAVDYPDTGGNVSQADIDNGLARPVIQLYAPQFVINWRTMPRGVEQVLSMVVIAEPYPLADDGFELTYGCQLKVLRLVKAGRKDVEGKTVNNGAQYHYAVEVWREPAGQGKKWDGATIPDNKTKFEMQETYYPTLPNGELFDEIPFLFFGAENNDVNVDVPAMADLADLNIAHYRNSADYEESSFVMGQPTCVVTGLTDAWYKNVLKESIPLGSYGGVPLGEGMDLKFVTAPPNTVPAEAMQHKETQMVALGARLVEQRNVQRTAAEATSETARDSSILASTANNVSDAIEWALRWCARFQGVEVPETGDGAIKFRLNNDFQMMTLTAEERKMLIAEYQAGGLSWGEWRGILRQGGIAKDDDKDAETAIKEAQDDELDRAVKTAEAMAKTAGDDKGNIE